MSISLQETREWVRVCRVDDVPDRGGRAMKLGDDDVALFRTSHGAIMATQNKCPHKGGVLSEGIVTGNHVVCPLHGWKIDMITGEAARPDKGCVHVYPVLVKDGDVYIDVTELAPPGGVTPLADITGVHPDSKRPKLGVRRAQQPDFSIHDFNGEYPVLAVEPASPDTDETFQLQITRKGKEQMFALNMDDLKKRYEVVDSATFVTCLMFDFCKPVNWTGVRLADVLEDLDLVDDFQFASFFSWDTTQTREGDRFFETLPRDYVLDPRLLLAFEMNGEPLPKNHGGPLRMVAPFLQGYKSVKWLSWIKLCQEDEIGYKRLHGFITFPEFHPPAAIKRAEV